MGFSLYKAILVIHITGITIMAGATFADFVLFRRLLRSIRHEDHKAQFLREVFGVFQIMMGIGMLVILISGVGMMAYLHMVWGQQTWFRVKMVLLIFVIVNGLGFRRMLGAGLLKLISADQTQAPQVALYERRMYLVQYVQMLLFLVMFCLSVFKFN